MDFSSWTSLVSETEKTSGDDIAAISRVYESFLSEYPLCYGFWKKYANHKARLSSVDQAVGVYEQAVKVATYSVDLWADYCSFGVRIYEDLDDVRRLYERGLSFVGKDYLSSVLWDQWLVFEHSYKQWNRLVYVYVISLRFPTKRLRFYYQSLKKLVASLEDESRSQINFMGMPEDSKGINLGNLNTLSDSKIIRIILDVLDQPSALYRSQALKLILTVGEYFFQRSSDIDEKISYFESKIRRPYFHVKSLDDCQLRNWHHYLDFVESNNDFDWTVKLYERCLIPCAIYPEFWVRYIECMEANGGREIATHAIERAMATSLNKVPGFHEYIAKIMEHTGNPYGARISLHCISPELLSNFIDRINQQANLEKRLGNIGRAFSIYEKAIDMLKDKQDLSGFCLLYTHFARFTYLVTGELIAAREVFVKGISRMPHCKLLFEGLISFMSIHGGKGEISSLDSIVERAIVPQSSASLALSPADRKDISKSFLEFVDLCGTTHEIRKAWARHMRLFPPIIHQEATLPAIHSTNGLDSQGKTKKSISGNKAETCDLDREAIDKDASSSKINDMEKEKKSLVQSDLRPSLENLSVCSPTNKKDGSNKVSSAMPNMPHHPREREKSIEISQQYQQQLLYQAPYSGYDQTNASSYHQPHDINIHMQAHYQQHPWPMVWQPQAQQDGNSSGPDHHHHQMLLHHQYQSQMWHHYYYNQQQQQLYYMQQQGGISQVQQEKNYQLQQQNIQLNISELEHLKKKMEVDHLQQQQQQQQHQQQQCEAGSSQIRARSGAEESAHSDQPRMSIAEATCSTTAAEVRKKAGT